MSEICQFECGQSSVIMSYFFDQSKVSQASSYQNTAFFQNDSNSRLTIFDQPIQSESQIAYELFNIDSRETESKEKSIISKLDIVDRGKDDYVFHQPLNSFPHQMPNNSSQNVESQESRMTFGNKPAHALYESKVEDHKKKAKFYEEPPSKQNGFLMSRKQSNQPSSNFSLFKGELSSNNRLREPESVPLNFQPAKETTKASKRNPHESLSSNSSSITIDFDEIRQRQMNEGRSSNKATHSTMIPNERFEGGKTATAKSECIKEPIVIVEESKPETRESHFGQREKKFEFNLRKSKVQDGKIQRIFVQKSNSPAPITPTPDTIYETTPIKVQKKVFQMEHSSIGLFKSRAKQPEEKNTEISARVGESQRKKLTFLRNPVEDNKSVKPERTSFSFMMERDNKKPVVVQRQEKSVEPVEKEQEPQKEVTTETTSKEKRESLGLKEQLKKLSSRPTEKVELKSIAFNKGFKFKPKPLNPQEKPKETPRETPQLTESIVNRTSEPEPKSRPMLNFKEEKMDFVPPRSTKNSDFTRFVITLMELQQETEQLKQRSIQSRNSYRQLAILNDDINRRIDEVLKRTSKK